MWINQKFLILWKRFRLDKFRAHFLKGQGSWLLQPPSSCAPGTYTLYVSNYYDMTEWSIDTVFKLVLILDCLLSVDKCCYFLQIVCAFLVWLYKYVSKILLIHILRHQIILNEAQQNYFQIHIVSFVA